MRHRRVGRKLKRTASHKKATLISLSTALLRNKRIRTTVAKAKETRPFVEKLITRAKSAVAGESAGEKVNVNARREVYRFIKDRTIVKELFSEIAPKVVARNGGYTRVVKLGRRFGDGAQVAVLELVDYNTGKEPLKKPASPKKKEQNKGEKKEAKKEA